jgi:hypothetical protein
MKNSAMFGDFFSQSAHNNEIRKTAILKMLF